MKINKDKLYSLEDIKKAFNAGSNYTIGSHIDFKQTYLNLDEYIQSLESEMVWDIEIEMEIYKNSKVYDQPDTLLDNPIPKILNNSIKITKWKQ